MFPPVVCYFLGSGHAMNEDSSESYDYLTTAEPDLLTTTQPTEPKLIKKKYKRFLTETEETKKLKNSELHRLVLLEQLKLTRLQIQREEIVLQKLANSTDDMSITLF